VDVDNRATAASADSQTTEGNLTMKLRSAIAGVAIVAATTVGSAGVVDAHFNNNSGKPFGGPLGTPTPGDGAQGHWRGLDCKAAHNSPAFDPLGICIWDD
jgi:hypothetical protein